MSECSIGGVQLNTELRCHALRKPLKHGAVTNFAFGGKEIIMTDSLPTLELTATLNGNQLMGYYTLTQMDEIIALSDYPHIFIHPLSPSGITVWIDKQTVAELQPAAPGATPSGAIAGDTYFSSQEEYFYYGTIILERLS
jgi:hypothetical protein